MRDHEFIVYPYLLFLAFFSVNRFNLVIYIFYNYIVLNIFIIYIKKYDHSRKLNTFTKYKQIEDEVR